MEQHDSRSLPLYTSLLSPPHPLFSSPLFSSLPLSPPPPFLSLDPSPFSKERISGRRAAEDAGRVRGTEERGGEEERRVNERRYRTLTCFGLISSGCFVLKPLALIWGPQHLELIITHTPAVLRLTVYAGYYIHFSTNFIQLMCWNLLLQRGLNCFIINLHKIQLHYNVNIQLTKRGVGYLLCSRDWLKHREDIIPQY